MCCTAVEELNNKKILPHEGTLAVKEQQMMHLLLQRKSLVKPILLGYHPLDDIHDFLMAQSNTLTPMVHVIMEDGEEEHLIWGIYDKPSIDKIEKSFSKLKAAYIGDGHHRATTVSLLNASTHLGDEANKYAQLFTTYFPFDQLRIWDYNRVVDIFEIMPMSLFMAHLSKYFTIKVLKHAKKPSQKHEVTFLIDKIWYSMVWKQKYIAKTDLTGILLDSALINKYVFQKILKIDDVRIDTRIKYFGGTEPLDLLIKQTAKCKKGVGLCIFQVSVDELCAIADKHLTLPPKSTFFLPRLLSGLVAKDL
jgi:uncharacterized protein (DUF1015 family)